MEAAKFDGTEFGDIDAVTVRKHMFEHVKFVNENFGGSIVVPWYHMDDIIQKILNNTYKTYSCSSYTSGMCRMALIKCGLLEEVHGIDEKNGRTCNVYIVPEDGE